MSTYFYYFDKTRQMVEFYPYFGVYWSRYNIKGLRKTSAEIAYSPKDNMFMQSNFLKPNSIYLNMMIYLTPNISINYTTFYILDAKDPRAESNLFFGIGLRFTFI